MENKITFPNYLSIQTTSLCNGHCIFCPYGEIKLKNEIDNLKKFQVVKDLRTKDKRKPFLAVRFFRYLKNYGIIKTYIKTRIHLWYLSSKLLISIRNILKKIRKSMNFIRNNLDLIGILNGSITYIGPHITQIDLTNDCNNNCIGCWCHSPLLGKSRLAGQKKKEYLSFGLVKEIIDDLYHLRTKTIQLSGAGEPFLHPEILKIIEYIKSKKMQCNIITSFSLINESIVRKLIDLKVDNLTISLWAAGAKTYVRPTLAEPKRIFIIYRRC